MHARLSRFAGLEPGTGEATLRQFEEGAASASSRRPIPGDHPRRELPARPGHALALWETEAEMRQSRRSQTRRGIGQVDTRTAPCGQAIVDDFEVVVFQT